MSEDSDSSLFGPIALLVGVAVVAVAGGFAGVPAWKWQLALGVLVAELFVVGPIAFALWTPWRCPGCRALNRKGRMLCRRCAATRPGESWRCDSCGSDNPRATQFCLDCRADRPGQG